MSVQYLLGKEIAARIKKRAKEEIKTLPKPPRLVTVMATSNQASSYYAESQQKVFAQMGMEFSILRLSDTITETELIRNIQILNANPDVIGILLVMPLPVGVNVYQVRQAIAPEKDVEGITPANMGRLFYGDFTIAPCTAKAVWLLLNETGLVLAGKETVVISHSEIVGKPLLTMLLASLIGSPTPTCCHIATKDLAFHTRRADILVVAVGKPGFITGDKIKAGSVVIDVGINLVQNAQTGESMVVGDADEKTVANVAGILTPVPGGVGTVTTAVLIENCVTLARLHHCR